MSTLSKVAITAVCALTWGGTAIATPITLGPNSYNDGNIDTAGSGSRANVDIEFAQSVPAGTYTISSLQYRAGGAVSSTTPGDVLPFIAVLNSGTAGQGNETYSVIAVGSDVTITSTGVSTANFTQTAANTFTLSSATTVYAGIMNTAGDNYITTNNGGVTSSGLGQDAHFVNGGTAPVVGSVYYEYASVNSATTNGKSNGATGQPGYTGAGSSAAYELSRFYDFGITVNSVPEPVSMGMVSLAAIGLLLKRKSCSL